MTHDPFQLVFISKTDPELSSDQLYGMVNEIHDVSVKNYAPLEISGAMLWVDGYFCQALEGPGENLERRFEVIQEDPRHHACKLLRYEPVDERHFNEDYLKVHGVFWDRIPNLSSALDNLGSISMNEASQAIVDAVMGETLPAL